MNFTITPDPIQKLNQLGNATEFEPAGSQPIEEQPIKTEAPNTRRPQELPCISEVSTPKGKKPILKSMLTTACERNCFYCPFRAGRSSTQRITFKPDEMASTFHNLQRANQVDGLFLSSGIIKGSVTTQDKIIDTAEIIRSRYEYNGYIHLKIMPGAEKDQIRRAMQLADRVSVNLEGPTEERLQALAPKKDFWQELIQRVTWINDLRQVERLRASVVTQFVVGAVGDTDLEILSLSEKLYQQLNLRRTYYSAFRPVTQTPFENLNSTPKQREQRLYQSSFLLRDYGWSVEELPFQTDTNLRLDMDPKQAWAEEHLHHAPVEINKASREELLRIPGIGPQSADKILQARQRGNLTEISHLRQLGIRNTQLAQRFLTLEGRMSAQQLSLF